MKAWLNFFLSIKNIGAPDFHKLLNWQYLTESQTPAQSPMVALLMVKFILLLLIGIIINFILIAKNKKVPIYSRLRGHIINMTTWLSVIGILLLLARTQSIYFFSSRIVLFIAIITVIIWSIWIIYYWIIVIPKLKIEYYKTKQFNNYLPKSKKIKKL